MQLKAGENPLEQAQPFRAVAFVNAAVEFIRRDAFFDQPGHRAKASAVCIAVTQPARVGDDGCRQAQRGKVVHRPAQGIEQFQRHHAGGGGFRIDPSDCADIVARSVVV